MSTFMERAAALYDAGRVTRLHALPTLGKHTIGQHVYGSLVVAAELCRMNNVDPSRVMLALLYHDAPEVLTGDVPAPTKRASKAINDALEAMEVEWYARLEVNVPTLTETELAVVRAADTLDLAFTALHERVMGNRHPKMTVVFSNCMSYLQEQEEKLKGVSLFKLWLREEWCNVEL